MAWDVAAAVEHLNENAQPKSLGRCGQYTREAIEAGGVTLTRRASAKDYGSSLLAVGFEALSMTPARHQPGDVVIVQPVPGHPHGHMAMYNGKAWVSDFVQRDIYPGQAYRKHKASFTVYRHPDAEVQ